MIKDDAIPNAEDKDDFFKWHAAPFRIDGLMNEFWIEIAILFSNLCILGQKNVPKGKTWQD